MTNLSAEALRDEHRIDYLLAEFNVGDLHDATELVYLLVEQNRRIKLQSATDTEPSLIRKLIAGAAWSPAPRKSQWGDGMLVAGIEITADETATIYIHKDGLAAAGEE